MLIRYRKWALGIISILWIIFGACASSQPRDNQQLDDGLGETFERIAQIEQIQFYLEEKVYLFDALHHRYFSVNQSLLSQTSFSLPHYQLAVMGCLNDPDIPHNDITIDKVDGVETIQCQSRYFDALVVDLERIDGATHDVVLAQIRRMDGLRILREQLRLSLKNISSEIAVQELFISDQRAEYRREQLDIQRRRSAQGDLVKASVRDNFQERFELLDRLQSHLDSLAQTSTALEILLEQRVEALYMAITVTGNDSL